MNTEKIIYSMSKVGKTHPPQNKVLRDISLRFFYGAKIGVLGLNGAGKSTLLRIMAGKEQEYEGEIVATKGYSVGMLEQEPHLDDEKTVQDVVEEAVQPIKQLLKDFDEVTAKFADPDADFETLLDEQAKLQEEIERLDAWSLDNHLEIAMEALGCPSPDTPIKILSGGERRRVALTRLLLTEPDILLLDEPTNHLDAESTAWLERHLRDYKGTVIAVTHDRYFLDNVAGWILELDRGYGIPWKGNYSSWLEQKQERLKQEEKSESKRQKTLARELEWVRMSPKAKQTKGKARLTAYENLLSNDYEKMRADLEIYIPAGDRLGNVVINFEGISKSFGERKLIDGLSAKLPPGSIVGVIGPNGAGKSTMLKMIAGQEQPDAGKIIIGETVQLAYADQSRALDGEKTVWEEISGGDDIVVLGERKFNSRAYVASFNFSGSDQQKLCKTLSGGERNRVHLAKTLRDRGNVLMLDEPTNDLDINTLRALEDSLENFAGSAVVVSHDRWFLDRIVTHILAFEGEGQVHLFLGNWSEYDTYQRKRLGDNGQVGSRKYRALKRE
jgi:sulfate-transporting ATPase